MNKQASGLRARVPSRARNPLNLGRFAPRAPHVEVGNRMRPPRGW